MRTHPYRLIAAIAAALVMTVAASLEIVLGCGGTPPPPTCGYTLTLAKSSPGPVPLTGGGTFPIDATVFFGLVETPPGSGVCPPPPYILTVDMTLTCVGGPGGSGSITLPIRPGFTAVSVPVTIPAGRPRICTGTGTATLPLSDGTVLTAMGDTVVCIVDPAPGDPSVPRLDMEHLTPHLLSAHPGDQVSNIYRFTNNDPTLHFDGALTVTTDNVSGMPGAAGPITQGVGPFALSDTGAGDDPPLLFADQLPPACCVPLPPDPQNSINPMISRLVALAPGQSKDIEIVVRKWGMCINGSCSEVVAKL
ncbi:MAG: hypothetical protein L0Y42_11605, partial [Phycisphaerales bacterium]|nr:hypothetical protein [Phycisphaerales bacterium]